MNAAIRELRLAFPSLCAMVLLAGCASAGGSAAARADRCKGKSLDPMFSEGRAVFLACEVDRQAKLASSLQSALGPPTASASNPGCSRVELEFVVDERGVPQADRIRTVRSTSNELLDQMRRAVPSMRYTPALKDGQPVPQLVSFGITRSSSIRVVGGRMPSAPARAPRC